MKSKITSTTKALIKQSKKGLFNNNGDFGALLLTQKHNNLRVISTPEFPVPYYQRISRNPPATEQVTIDMTAALEAPNQGTVLRTKYRLAKHPEGLKVLDFVENQMKSETYITSVRSVAQQCNIYADDLIHYLDSAHEENVRILKTCDLADALK